MRFSSAGNLGFTNPIVCNLGHYWYSNSYHFRRQLSITNPLLNLKVFKSKIFTFSTITSMIVMMSMVGPALLNSFICSKWTWVECIYVWIGHYARAF